MTMPPTSDHPNYWGMSDLELAAAWREVDAMNLADDCRGEVAEQLNMVEDAVLQRIGAPDTASGDEPKWQAKIRRFGYRGRRVRLQRCSDPYTRLEPGAEGTVTFVDDLGTLGVKWDSGSTLGLVPGVDAWEEL